MVKSIIKRIIVGVGIALVLMALKDGGLIATVSALETKRAMPSYIQHTVQGGTTKTQSSPSVVSIAGLDTDFYSMTVQDTGQFTSLKFGFSNSGLTDSDISQNLNMSFLLLLSPARSAFEQPLRVYVSDRNRYVQACNVSSGVRIYQGSGSDSQMAYFSVVNCNNIALRTYNFDIYVLDSFYMANGDTFGITPVSIFPNNSSAQSTIDAINNQTQAQQDTNNTLNDSTIDDPSSDISSMNSKVASNNSITQLLTLPIQMYQNILNAVSGSCSSFSLGSLYNHNLTLPCINLQNLLGSTLYGIIDILISGLFILSFRKKMVDIFNHMTSLNDRGNELE